MARLAQTDPFVSGPDGKPVMGKDGKPVSNYSDAQKNALTQWGYNPAISPNQVVDHNKETGLFAIRFEPSETGAKNGVPPVVAFRGTEPDRGPKDLQSDVKDKYIGATQYEPAKAEIAKKLFGGDSKVDVVGYSLGGALAQRSLVDNAQNVRALSTFQAPGIDGTDAKNVNDSIAKYGIDAQHHFFTNDIVHRAGEAKVNGNYHEYTKPGWATGIDSLTAHTSSFLIGSDAGTGSRDAHGAVKTQDGYGNVTDNAKIQNYQNDRQTDRAFWENQRRTLGPSGGNLLDLAGPAMNLWQKTDGEFNTVLGPDGKPIPGPLQGAWNQANKGAGQFSQGWGELWKGGSEYIHGVGDVLRGNYAKGAKELGGGLLDVWNGARHGAGGIGDMWSGAQNGYSTLKDFWNNPLSGHLGDMKKVLGGVPEILAHLGHDKSLQDKLGPHGGPIVEGLATAYDQGKPLVNNTIAGLSNAKNEVTGGFGDLKSGTSSTMSGIGQSGHGVWDILHGNFRQGAGELFGGAKNVVNGVQTGAHGIGDMWNGVRHGAGTVGNAWNGAKQIWNDNISSNADHYSALAGQVMQPLTQPVRNFTNTVTNTATSIGHGIQNGYNSAVNTASNVVHNVGTGIQNGYNSAVNTASNVAHNVGTGISNGYHAAANTASNIGHGISNGVSNLANRAKKLWPF